MSDVPRIAIFDFDGVVLESLDVKSRAFADLFADHPEHVDEIVRFHLANGGMSRFEKFRYVHNELLQVPLTEEEEQRLGRRFSELVLDEILRCPFVPGARELLESLAESTPLYVASGTPEDELREIVERRGLVGLFRGVYGTPRTKAELLQAICHEAGVDPSDAVFVGDARSDCEGAAVVGIPFIGRRIKDLELPFDSEDAMFVVDDLVELAARWPELTTALRHAAVR